MDTVFEEGEEDKVKSSHAGVHLMLLGIYSVLFII